MFCYVKDNFLYLNIPRNGSNTFGAFFHKHGWTRHNLFENTFNLDNMTIFGHITDPLERHTKGLAMYIRINSINIDRPELGKILVSGVFDEHTCSISMMMGPLFSKPVHWIPLDLKIERTNKIYNGNDFTNDFFREHNLGIIVSEQDNKNMVVPEEKLIRDKIKDLKKTYNQNFQQIVKNFLEQDLILYASIVKKYNEQY